ncbi:GrxA family glutaredoxin [Halomonas halmophila]|uniref:Glutaredoxin, GrxA family protein n=1 Tax=Halomonas halmophila TaxID=252 RepID=A0A4Y4F5N5_9GAMM|nr:GrxA family glutaredoxin [Halomonas halmophila]GED22428.1 glutaredoxin, GrxA family protein [Halomonas halmophila]
MFIVIFGRPACPFCVRAEALAEQLQNAGAIEGYRYVDIVEEGISKADMAKTIGKPVHTVPQIFADQTHIGGFTEFNQYVTDHQLLSEAAQ